MELLFICLLFAVGIFLVLKPEMVWRMEHPFLSAMGYEPSDISIAILRVIGALLFLAAFIGLVLFLLHLLPDHA